MLLCKHFSARVSDFAR